MTSRYVLGLGGTVDYELEWEQAAVQRLADRHHIARADLRRDGIIRDERGLLCSILAHLRDGVGAERHVESPAAIPEFARRLGYRATLGGTCVRAALALDALGVPSTVHLVSIDDTVRRLLPPSVSYVCSAEEDSLEPHLIVQYPQDARIQLTDGTVEAPAANRLIYVNDASNRNMALAPDLPRHLAQADVVLLSGLNSMQDEHLLALRLHDLSDWLATVPEHAVVYFEDAGYHVPAIALRVRDALSRLVDVWAMNEDELQQWVGRPVDLLDAEDVAAALRRLARIVPAPVRVVHTRHWALAHGRQAARFRRSLRSGIVTAATRYRIGDGFTPAHRRATAAMAVSTGGSAFRDAVERLLPDVACEPGYDLDVRSPTTIGLGDTFVGGFLWGTGPARPDERANREPRREAGPPD